MQILDGYCESQLVSQKGQTADWSFVVPWIPPVCLNNKLRDSWHELTTVLLSVIMWFAERIMIGRLEQINVGVGGNKWEKTNKTNLKIENKKGRKVTRVHISLYIPDVHSFGNALICSLSFDSCLCVCVCLGMLKWKTHRYWCWSLPKFTVKRIKVCSLGNCLFVCIYRFIRLYARVLGNLQDLRFSAERCSWNINKAVSY